MQTRTEDSQVVQPSASASSAEYQPPTILVLGSVSVLTQGTNRNSPCDGALGAGGGNNGAAHNVCP